MSPSLTGTETDFIELAEVVEGKNPPAAHSHAAAAIPAGDGAAKDAPADPSSHAPRVEVHRSDDGTETIEFICSCGERLRVRLEYDGD